MANAYTAGPQTLQSAATTGNGGILFVGGQSGTITINLQSNGTTSGGTVTIEEAYYDVNGPVYAGTWSAIAAIAASGFTGTAQSVLRSTGAYWAVRARISSTITGGGTVTVVAWAN